MQANQIIDVKSSAIVNAPIEKVDIPSWCFGLTEEEYMGCSPAHVAAGSTKTPDGKRVCINVETIGGSLMVQHFVETLSQKDHLVLNSDSDVFTPYGRTTVHVQWELTVKKVSEDRCELTTHVQSFATDEMLGLLNRQGIPFDLFRSQNLPIGIAHNEQETPRFAASIARAALRH
ncbi:hypothetical protein [Rhizobium sp. BK418]|uniref:hypothetical protein n=1 Tax=Rhizobium sp. BK418 TaxID=2512120 RepID=UPI00104B80D8|nr:hypothetical protein [Rhizobium sp. BK418]TCR97851.1 hypothetical protein EV281_11070 [Rhizobium sp. BK418]